jgi:hypothetical protein
MFRFTIRDVLWLTALVAVSIGWWLDHPNNVRARRKLAYLKDSLDFEQRVFGNIMRELNKEGRDLEIHKNGTVKFFKRDFPATLIDQ